MDNKIASNPKNGRINRWNIASICLIFVAAPAVVFFSFTYLEENRYFFLSGIMILILLMIMVFTFEGKRPDARILIIIAVMSAIAVVGRAVFFFAPNFKPVSAIVIMAGICFGRNIGFMTGMISMFVSNFIFGQGPWTPWQMLAMGIIGYLSGAVFDDGKDGRRANRYAKNRKLMTVLYCIFGFVSVFFIYGGITDLWTILGFYGKPSLKSAIIVYSAATTLNFIHGVSTVVFLILLVIPMKTKLDRIKTKYGLSG